MVSIHMSWVCGFLVVIGFGPPFARADDLERVARSAAVSARISLQQELRAQTHLMCLIGDAAQRQAVERIIDKLREEYRQVTKGDVYPEPRCAP